MAFLAEDLAIARFLESERVIPRDVGIHGHLQSTDEQQKGLRANTEVDRRSHDDIDGQEIKVREKRKVDEGDTPRRDSSEVDAIEQERNFASVAGMKILWVILMCFLGWSIHSSYGKCR